MTIYLKTVYKSKAIQKAARAAAVKDKGRQRLLKHYTRTQDAINSLHPIPWMTPIRQYILSIIAWRIERNTVRHLYKATKVYLSYLTHLNTLSWAYKNLCRQHKLGWPL